MFFMFIHYITVMFFYVLLVYLECKLLKKPFYKEQQLIFWNAAGLATVYILIKCVLIFTNIDAYDIVYQ